MGKRHQRVQPYKSGSWNIKQANGLIAHSGGWRNPDDLANKS
jgi:hypothetical protein